MALVRALGKRKLDWSFWRSPCAGQATLFNAAISDTQNVNSSSVKPYKDIPGPGGLYQWPIFGSLLHFKPFTDRKVVNLSKIYSDMINKYGQIVRLRLGRPMVLICNPKDAETLFKNEGKYPVRISTDIMKVYAERNNFKNTLTDTNGEEWYKMRAPLNKRLMRADSALHYLPQQNQVADEFVDLLLNPRVQHDDLYELFFRFASESIGLVCFNTRLGFLDPVLMNEPERAAFQKASKDIFLFLHRAFCGESVAHAWYRNKTYRDYEAAKFIVRNLTLRLMEEAKKVLESRESAGTIDLNEPNLLLNLLSDKSLEYEDIVNAMQSLYAGGTDSTGKNLMCFFYNLAKNPEKQEKLRVEIISVVGRDQPVTERSLEQMPYLKASVKESFRLISPTVSGTGRILPKDVVMSGYRIPAGIFIQIHNPKACMEYFEQPDKFLPERWLRSSDGRQCEKIPNLASLPFGFGPRNCIGRRFAEQEIYLATIKALQKMKIEIEPESANTKFIHTLFVMPENPIKFRFTKLDRHKRF